MRKMTLALAAVSCLALAAPPALASTMSNSRPSSDGTTKSAITKQMLAQAQYGTTKKKDENNTQDQTKRKSWGGGG
jgi:acid phosphatase class B